MELKGIGVSPGVAMGQALVVEREAVAVFRLLLAPEAVEVEVQRLTRAVEASQKQLLAIKERLAREVGGSHAYIFDAHLLMLEDSLLLDRAVTVIREDHVIAEWALRTVADQLHALFDEFTDAYLRERSTDLDDVLGRVQINLGGAADAPSLSRLPGSFVLVTEDLTPSEAAELDWERILAVAMDAGSPTHHTAILARSFGIPAVAGLQDAVRRVPPGSLVVVDGTGGRLVVEPTAPTLEGFRAVQQRHKLEEERLQANVEFLDEADTALLYGAEGIGLFRSEYLLGRSREWPAEKRQLDVYCRLAELVRPHAVTVRTWDVGPEDLAPGGPTSPNPALGERSLRLLRRAPEAFRGQLRALLQAAAHGALRIMFPFVSGPADFEEARQLLEEARQELSRDGLPFGDRVPVGVTIEVPSAAMTADLLASRVDFFSVGTNDLIQYLLAVDRTDPRVSAHYQPLHPAVLRAVRGVVEAAERVAIPVSVCGEMAADPTTALVLVGLGVKELSMSPAAIPRVKAALRGASFARLKEVAEGCLALPSAREIEARLRAELSAVLAAGPVLQGE
ncbi:MAG: phosphoenolpyruvate--protein phosphotransferase [Acidobacteria bacterium]|nr:MAG: phosphoenolpyruvate--protein phosphotransferase [Acidobacteriota bacterium]